MGSTGPGGVWCLDCLVYYYCGLGRNHVFKVGGPIFWAEVLLPFFRKKFRKVYPVWRSLLPPPDPHEKSTEKAGGPSKFGGSGPPYRPSCGCAHDCGCRNVIYTSIVLWFVTLHVPVCGGSADCGRRLWSNRRNQELKVVYFKLFE